MKLKLRDRIGYAIARFGLSIASPEYRAFCTVVNKEGLDALKQQLIKDLS